MFIALAHYDRWNEIDREPCELSHYERDDESKEVGDNHVEKSEK